jgi:probable phosphoglycerate mutase
MTVLLLVRHGHTDAAGKVLVGWTPGVHLSDGGRKQADSLVERLAGLPIAAIYSSPLERCRETASPLAVARGLRIEFRDDLGETRYGRWTNRSIAQVRRTRLWREVQQAPSMARFPDGESLLDVQGRAVAELQRIAAANDRRMVAVFSHSDVIKLALAHFAGVHADLFQRLVVDTCSVSVVELGRGVPRISKMNDTGDLTGLVPVPRRRGAPPSKVRG